MITTAKEPDETDRKILKYVSQGLSYGQIATRLYLSVPTIKYKVKAMKKEFKCPTLLALIRKFQD